jgi:hypothetical protein
MRLLTPRTAGAVALAALAAATTTASTATASVLPTSQPISKVTLRPFDVRAAPLAATGLVPGRPPVTQLIVATAPRGDGARRVTLRFVDVIDKELGCVEPELEYDPTCSPRGELSQQLTIEVRRTDPDSRGRCRPASRTDGIQLLPPTTLSAARGLVIDAVPGRRWIRGGQTMCVTTLAWLPDRPDNNVVQSDGVSFRVSIASDGADEHGAADDDDRGDHDGRNRR